MMGRIINFGNHTVVGPFNGGDSGNVVKSAGIFESERVCAIREHRSFSMDTDLRFEFLFNQMRHTDPSPNVKKKHVGICAFSVDSIEISLLFAFYVDLVETRYQFVCILITISSSVRRALTWMGLTILNLGYVVKNTSSNNEANEICFFL